MKRILLITLFFAAYSVFAQVPTTDTNSSPALGDTPQVHKHKKSNVLGAPVYYDLNGNIVGSSDTSSTYHRPAHHYLNNMEDQFSTFFAEMAFMAGSHDVAVGANLAYIPRQYGINVSVLGGNRHSYLTIGPAFRLSDYDNLIDWQLYFGIGGAGRHFGGEVGLRMAAPSKHDFSMTSFSFGYSNFGGHGFVKAGLSIDILAIVGASLLLY